ncbi:glycerophosphodiester phosphodiesterase family protein [Poseidonocella sp. HB161398]|uniref:glycerophosphodiester phosphodiesterase n=1 Tax=Poseidonocella sp. HB161398 TaxID=2320855 RepID=UPI00110984C1|nr:glycerophosphodiester phosphodiesterase family protein [Poseidonocella sp. HB161398]
MRDSMMDGLLTMDALLRREAPLACAERGLWSQAAPENSVPALEAAMEAGCEMAGFDLRLSREGDLVAFRDPDLSRMTAARGPVAGMATASLTRLPLRGGRGGGAGLSRSYLPLATELLAAADGRCLLVFTLPALDALPAVLARLAACGAAGRAVLRAGFADPAGVQAFAAAVSAAGLGAMPRLRLGPPEADGAVLAALLAARPAMAEVPGAPAARIAALAGPLAAAGIPVMAGAPGNGPEDGAACEAGWAALCEAGVRAVATSQADAFLRWRAGRVAA